MIDFEYVLKTDAEIKTKIDVNQQTENIVYAVTEVQTEFEHDNNFEVTMNHI